MKLCIVTSSFIRFKGDYSGQHVYNQAQDLSRSHEVHVIYPAEQDYPDIPEEGFIRHPFTYPFKMYPMSQAHGWDLLNTPKLFSRMAKEIKRVGKEHDIDVFYAFWTIPAAFICSLACGTTPYIIGMMGSDDKVFGKLGLARPFIHRAVRNATRIIALSEELKQQAIDMGVSPQNITIIPSGIDIDTYHPYDRAALKKELGLPPKRMVLFVGSLFKLKRVDWLVRLTGSLGKYHSFHTVVIGDGPERKALEDMATRLRVSDITFLGRVSYDEVPRYMAAAETLVLFSETEGLPSSVQESLSCGTPVIATNVGGLSDIVRDGTTGYLVNRESEAAVAIGKLFNGAERGKAMGRLAREFACRYLSHEVTSRQVCRVCESAIPSEKPTIGLLSTFKPDFLSGVIDVQQPLAEHIHVVAPALKRADVFFHPIKYCIGSNFLSHIKNQAKAQASMSIRVWRLRKEVDFWMFMGGDVFLLPGLVAKLTRKPVFLTLLGDLEQETMAKKDPLNPIQMFLRKINCILADRIVLLSAELVTRWGLEKYAAKCRVGQSQHIDPSVFKITRPLADRERVVGYVGRLSPEKGIREMLRAVPLVLARDKQVRFLITGDGPLADDIRQLVRSTGLEKTVRFTGRVPYGDIPALLNECRLIVMPSQTEGLPGTLLEAMACGTPVLATPVGAVADIIADGETGYFLRDTSAEEIARGILRALDADHPEELSARAREMAESDYCLETTRREYQAIIREGVKLSNGKRKHRSGTGKSVLRRIT